MRYILLAIVSLFSNNLCGEDEPNSIVFSRLYEKGEWGKTPEGYGSSGEGSSFKYVTMYLEYLKDFLETHQIKSVVDLGCGDWEFSHLINWMNIDYLGIDVVKKVIEKNNHRFASPNIHFAVGDATTRTLPSADLLICKEVLQHLPFRDIEKIIAQFPQFKYCLIVNDVDPETLTCKNEDIPRGHYRLLDLTKPPFNLKGQKVLSYRSRIETKMVLLITNAKQ
jgi:SAM-dependent methyltransferase